MVLRGCDLQRKLQAGAVIDQLQHHRPGPVPEPVRQPEPVVLPQLVGPLTLEATHRGPGRALRGPHQLPAGLEDPVDARPARHRHRARWPQVRPLDQPHPHRCGAVVPARISLLLADPDQHLLPPQIQPDRARGRTPRTDSQPVHTLEAEPGDVLVERLPADPQLPTSRRDVELITLDEQHHRTRDLPVHRCPVLGHTPIRARPIGVSDVLRPKVSAMSWNSRGRPGGHHG